VLKLGTNQLGGTSDGGAFGLLVRSIAAQGAQQAADTRAAAGGSAEMAAAQRDAALGLHRGASARVATAARGAAAAAHTATAAAAAHGLGRCAVEALDVSDNGLHAGHADVLSNALLVSHTLRFLDLSRNGLGAEGAAALARALGERSVRLERLDLHGNHLGGDISALGGRAQKAFVTQLSGVRALALALAENDSLTELDLGGNALCGVLVGHPGPLACQRGRRAALRRAAAAYSWSGADGGGVGVVGGAQSSGSDDDDDEESDEDDEGGGQDAIEAKASMRLAAEAAMIAAIGVEAHGDFDDAAFVSLCASLRVNTRLRRVGLAANAIGGYYAAPRTRTSLHKMRCLGALGGALGATSAIDFLDLRGNELALSDGHTYDQLDQLRRAGIEAVI
jgi:hypothetical protein